jgi:hypothetical protein
VNEEEDGKINKIHYVNEEEDGKINGNPWC